MAKKGKSFGFVAGVVLALIAIVLAVLLFVSKEGLIVQFMWKYKIPKEKRADVRRELRAMTKEEVKYYLKNGPQ